MRPWPLRVNARVHVDPALKRASVYKSFIWRLVSLGMVRLSLDAGCECGVFCVWKKNGMQRVIVDARSINQRCRKMWRQKRKKRRDREFRLTGLSRGKTLTNGEIRRARVTMAARGPTSLRAPRICRTIQASRVVERIEQRSRSRNRGQLPEGRHGFRAVCLGDRARSGGRMAWRSREHPWNTWTSCSLGASGPMSGIG